MTHVLATSVSTFNPTVIWTVVPVVFFAAAALIAWSWFRLQGKRTDAAAMAEYRRLAEEAVANQRELRAELAKLTAKVDAVEQLMRDVG